ncbi:hypothetical protein CC86DRAFT_470525 [Ophiobolus disseminans]|uniref:Zn(2)-C6 fungal-type domain-containing protein n=1 Tax=Ophiobolus disseminans TaxID=1469910 RepID=A0A6A6ZM90_9PLEO|nr:hypothetical protein CC86DRAFT_470525 [Ophiobolus disseminans]
MESQDTEQSPSAGASNQDDDASKIKRTQIACLNCRKRKSRCLLDESGSIPCLRCKRDNLDCVLGGSNRGGRRVRKKPRIDDPPATTTTLPPLTAPRTDDGGSFHALGNLGTWSHEPSVQQQQYVDDDQGARSGSSNTDELHFTNLQNPSDALGILARVAGESSSNEEATNSGKVMDMDVGQLSQHPLLSMPAPSLSFSYPLLDRGILTVHSLCQLLIRFQQHYHPYYPVAPAHAFDSSRLAEMVTKERHLLTALLLVASKDLVDEPHIYEACMEHMKSLVSDLAAGGDADIEAVEALLLLAEWAPYTQRGSGKVGKGEEDKESWMHVGLALRIAYFLALDRYSFRFVDQGKDPDHDRKRLIWTSAYVSDRHTSIRIGKAFWSRGPGPLTTLRREDYPSLIPKSPNEEDYASIFQANLELTQLFSNVHDTLYSNPSSSFRSHMSGSYIKFIDDFRSAIYGWKSVWGTLTCSPHLKACLLMSYDYLRLYTNAFAFQATVLRALPAASNSTNGTSGPGFSMQAPQRVFTTNNVGAVGDARFIYEGLDAAKAILTTVNNFVNPERSLRFMPLRYYLYLVYAGVFLYRARCTGVISSDEDRAIRAMINETVARLQRSSVGSGIGIQHPGSRYSQLLKMLWAKAPRKDKASRSSFRHPGTHIASNPVDSNGLSHPAPILSPQESAGTGESPELMGDFGWTDLSAVSDFASGQAPVQSQDEASLWNGFLPLDMGWGAQGFGFEGFGGGVGEGELGMLF